MWLQFWERCFEPPLGRQDDQPKPEMEAYRGRSNTNTLVHRILSSGQSCLTEMTLRFSIVRETIKKCLFLRTPRRSLVELRPRLLAIADFLEGLKEVVKQSMLFESTSLNKGGDYKLKAYLFDITQPLGHEGGDASVEVEIAWTFYSLKSDEILWRKSIKTNHFAKGDHHNYSYPTPIVRATEGATRKNIQAALEHIANLDLQSK